MDWEQPNDLSNDSINANDSSETILRRSKRNHRAMIADNEKQPEKIKQKSIRRKTFNKLTLKEKINREAPINEYVINELVMATIPGYAPWPARIIDISGEIILVEFFGTGEK